jgi:hypothetical protein
MCSIPSKSERKHKVYVFEEDSLAPKITYVKINQKKILNEIKKKITSYFIQNEVNIKQF